MKRRNYTLIMLFLAEGLIALFLLICSISGDTSFDVLLMLATLSLAAGTGAAITKQRWRYREFIVPLLPFIPLILMFAGQGADLLALVWTILIGASAVPGILLINYLSERNRRILRSAALSAESNPAVRGPNIPTEIPVQIRHAYRLGPIEQVPLD